MKLVVFVGTLGMGGTEKAACRWARGLKDRGHEVYVQTLINGPRRAELAEYGIPVNLLPQDPAVIAEALLTIAPAAIHAHAPGSPFIGDVLGDALARLPAKIPVVQTNIFGRLENPREDKWTDHRLFISWTSCVQAARRSFRRLDEEFFRRASVAVYPVDPVEEPSTQAISEFRKSLGVQEGEVLFGRFSRPEPNKWTNLVLDAFRAALSRNRRMKLLLREPPAPVAHAIRSSADAEQFVILPATSDQKQLRLTMSVPDIVLHTSSIGESFGYGIAEPMNLGKPVVTHTVPWQDQAQIELVPHGECGFVTGDQRSMTEAILELAGDKIRRAVMGHNAREHIRKIACAETSIKRLESALQSVVAGGDNPFAAQDLQCARTAARQLNKHQFGHSLREQLALRPFYLRVRFHEFRKAIRTRRAARKLACSTS